MGFKFLTMMYDDNGMMRYDVYGLQLPYDSAHH
mgnify:CR=1 FL=1